MQAMRTSARISAEVRHVPLVFPAARAAGRNSRGFEVFVVNAPLAACRWSFATAGEQANDER